MRYSAIMIDQVDDRDAFMDILFGAIKNIKMKRSNLHIVLCASTTSAVKLKIFSMVVVSQKMVAWMRALVISKL